MPSLYLLGYIVSSALYVVTEAFQERTLDGGAARPLGINLRSPGTAPQKRAGRPMGPSTPLC